jgi:hypothetical protein
MAQEAYSFAPEELAGIVKIYTETIEKINSLTQSFVGKLEECGKKTESKPFVDFYTGCVDFYNNDVTGEIKKNFGKWAQSDDSLHALARAQEKDNEDLQNTVRETESKLEEVQGSLVTMESKKIPTPNSRANDEHYEELAGVVNDYVSAMDETFDEKVGEVRKKAEDNALYQHIEGLVGGTLRGVMSAFEVAKDKVDELKDLFHQKGIKARSLAETSTAEIEQQAMTVGQELGRNRMPRSGGF